jgi:hypothetical protein
VDFNASQIWLEKRQTKGKVARVLPVYGEMRTILVSALAERDLKVPDCKLIFHRDGKRIVDFRKAWAKATVAAGVPWLHFHDLRRSAVRNMDRAGVPRATIRRIIGHETDAMFDRYRIVDQRDVDEAGKKAEQYLIDQNKSEGDAEEGSPADATQVTTLTRGQLPAEPDCTTTLPSTTRGFPHLWTASASVEKPEFGSVSGSRCLNPAGGNRPAPPHDCRELYDSLIHPASGNWTARRDPKRLVKIQRRGIH